MAACETNHGGIVIHKYHGGAEEGVLPAPETNVPIFYANFTGV